MPPRARRKALPIELQPLSLFATNAPAVIAKALWAYNRAFIDRLSLQSMHYHEPKLQAIICEAKRSRWIAIAAIPAEHRAFVLTAACHVMEIPAPFPGIITALTEDRHWTLAVRPAAHP